MELLSEVEVRIISSLIEKEITTPEYYPLTVNSLMNACNQKSNREPVVQYDDELIEKTLLVLRDKKFVCRVTGTDIRVPKYKQIFTGALELSSQETAVMCVLMLRGPQTVGEIKSRSGRLYEFRELGEVEEVLIGLSGRETSPLVAKLPRLPGRDGRYAHILCGVPVVHSTVATAKPEKEKISELEEKVDRLEQEIKDLTAQFAEFRKQFE